MGDNVNHPEHYQSIAGVEAIDILNDVVKDLPGKQAAMLWNSMKYLFRFQKKNGVEDLKKARNYLDYLIADMEEMQPTNDEHILYKSTVWGNAEVYYSTNMPEGTCTKIVFDDKGGRDTFAIKFFRYLSCGIHGFSIRDILEDAKYLFPKEDNSLRFNMPWNDIFKGFHMTNENGKYVLEFIIDLQGGK
jgi:hypothetical protein